MFLKVPAESLYVSDGMHWLGMYTVIIPPNIALSE